MSSAPVLRTAAAGAVQPVRLFARTRLATGDPASPERLDEVALAPGEARVGPLVVSLRATDDGQCATWSVRVQNAAPHPVQVDSVGLGFAWTAPDVRALRFLRQGHQSWSFAGGEALDDAGARPFPSGPWLRGFHRATWEPPADRGGWHESDGATVAAAGDGALSAGALETGRAFAVAYLRRDGHRVRVEVEQRLERPLEPGESIDVETVRLALGLDPNALLEGHAAAQGRAAGARACAPFQAGWCSWYQFFHDVDEDAFLRNLDALVAARDDIPIELVQLDDGFQRAVGDWLDTNEKFPSGLAAIAKAVRGAGFTPGIWTAPFCVVPESRLFEAHADWLLRDPEGDGPLRGLHHPIWTKDGWVLVLDASQPDVVAHLAALFRSLVEMGFSYLKLDFLYAQALRARASDPRLTRAARLRGGLAAVRAGAGEGAFLLGCGCPLGPAVGIVDGMRIGPDTAPYWTVPGPGIPGLLPTLPAGRNALRNTLARAWMHRRFWLNDPDCLVARREQSKLSRDEVRALAASIAVTGGMAIFSDDVPALTADERALVRETFALAREVDEAAHEGTARAVALLDGEIAPAVVARAGADWLVALFNDADVPRVASLELAAHGVGSGAAPEALLGSPAASVADGRIAVELAAHGGALYRFRGSPRLAVFCDFDGTFAVQDVGSTLARRYAGERRAALWPRLERGELDAWAYNMELLDGLALPEAELEAFLRTVELDPGARDLVAWCEERRVPFRVLSDGFDRNLDRLQQLHGLRFAYDANRLRYEDGVWRIAAGSPDPTCSCGTGTCKRARIARFRERHPDVPVVHIGNGRVSDLCASETADRVFAKDTLAEELARRGIAFEPFTTLHDVIARLAVWLAAGELRPDR